MRVVSMVILFRSTFYCENQPETNHEY